MEAKDTCVCLETAEALHDAGIVVDSYFHWWRDEDGYFIDKWIDFGGKKLFATRNGKESYYVSSAPTAEELRKYLKTWVSINDKRYKLTLTFEDNGSIRAYYFCYQVRKDRVLCGEIKEYEKLCEAFADVIMKLKEAGYEYGK